MTRALEVAPGLLVNPDHVRVVRDEPADNRLVTAGHCVVVVGAGGFYVEGWGTAAEVAAKLWPVEGEGPGHIERWHGVELHALREAFRELDDTDPFSMGALLEALKDYLGEP